MLRQARRIRVNRASAAASMIVVGALLAGVGPHPGTSGTTDPSSVTALARPGGTKQPAGVRWSSGRWGDATVDKGAKGTDGRNDPAKDSGSLATVTSAVGARAVWAAQDADGRAVTGRGVTVAVLDTGVSTDVAGLDAAGKVVTGPDLALDANSPDRTTQDEYGHGTHMAGIIAARDEVKVAKDGQPKPAQASVQLGVAPDAQLLAVKLGTRDGSTDVSQVIAGLDWVVQHRADNGMHVRVVNLSYGTASKQSYRTDPLAAAVENAWQHGIVVVVSGGNDGTAVPGLTDPAIDPYVIAVGASDPQGKASGWKAPTVADFSSRGTPARHVDLLAPGRSIASLRDPGSFVDVNHPEGRVAGDATGRLFRGSGSSQAAAVVSGSVALLLQAHPDLTPDEVKALLTSSADPMPGSSVLDVGAGELNVAGALARADAVSSTPAASAAFTALATQSWTPSTGLGSLEAARGGSHLVDPDSGTALAGEVDVQGVRWVPGTWRAASVAGTSWSGGRWNGARWTGDGWSGARWTDASWSGARWWPPPR
jgi:serine protease AprX